MMCGPSDVVDFHTPPPKVPKEKEEDPDSEIEPDIPEEQPADDKRETLSKIEALSRIEALPMTEIDYLLEYLNMIEKKRISRLSGRGKVHPL